MITEEIKTLLRAIVDDKQMQSRVKGCEHLSWKDVDTKEALTFIANTLYPSDSSFDLRIKPEPKRLYGNPGEYSDAVGFGDREEGDTHYIDILDGNIVAYGRLEK